MGRQRRCRCDGGRGLAVKTPGRWPATSKTPASIRRHVWTTRELLRTGVCPSLDWAANSSNPTIETRQSPRTDCAVHVTACGPERRAAGIAAARFSGSAHVVRHSSPHSVPRGCGPSPPISAATAGPRSRSASARTRSTCLLTTCASWPPRFGHRRFTLIGHDWGGIVAWHLASTRPAVLERMAISTHRISASPPRFARGHPLQWIKSAYVGYFQLPVIPELSLTSWDCGLLVAALERSSRPGAFSAEDLRIYRDAWTQPGAMTAMLNWYRAMALQPTGAPNRIAVPVRVIWGDRDSALEPGLAEESASVCDAVEVIHLPKPRTGCITRRSSGSMRCCSSLFCRSALCVASPQPTPELVDEAVKKKPGTNPGQTLTTHTTLSSTDGIDQRCGT